MREQIIHTDARERVLAVAERLFSERGYAAVTLRDIADALEMRQASLYYHVPGGKEALFIEVTERGMRRHREGLEQAISEAGTALRDQLQAAARWLLVQPALNFGRLMKSDMPAISETEAQRLRLMVRESLLIPLETAFAPTLSADDLRRVTYLSGAFLAIIEGIHNLPTDYLREPKEAMADYLIDVMLNGVGQF